MGPVSVLINTMGSANQTPVWIYIDASNSTDEQIAVPGYLNQWPWASSTFLNGQVALVLSKTGSSMWDVVVENIRGTITYSLVLNTDGSVTNVTATSPVLSSGGLTPNISLVNQGVAGSFTNANVTTDQYGIVTAISNGVSSNLPFTVITTSQTLAANHGYIINSGTRLNLLMPTSFNLSDEIWLISINNSPWRLTQNAGQNAVYGLFASTVGTGGYVDSLGPDMTTNCGTVTFVGATANTVMSVGVAPSNTLNFQ